MDEAEETTPAYRRDGYSLVRRVVPPEVAHAMLVRLKGDLARNGTSLDRLQQQGALLQQPAAELYGHHYPMFASFHWGLTALVERLTGETVLPTYCYFRRYRQGDICRVHGDRPACEHSLSLTLGYADGQVWPLQVARRRTETPYARADEDFSPEELPASAGMEVGDAVLYQGVHHHHGRTTPNPNRWSAHLFLHWVARDRPYAAEAFDRQTVPPLGDL